MVTLFLDPASLAIGVISMVHIVVLGAGIGGLPTAYELRRLLPKCDRITLISDNN